MQTIPQCKVPGGCTIPQDQNHKKRKNAKSNHADFVGFRDKKCQIFSKLLLKKPISEFWIWKSET